MVRSAYLPFLLFMVACSTDARGGGKSVGNAHDDTGNAAVDDGKADGSVASADGGGSPDDSQGNGGEPPAPPPDEVPAFLSFNAMIGAMRADTLSVENPAARKDIRYLVLSQLGNAGFKNSQIAVHRSTMNLLVNSLSRGSQLVKPEPLSGAPNVYRINLRDYRWTPQQWENLVVDYPFQVTYKADSVVFKRDEKSADDLREATGTKVPFVFMEWFADRALSAPIYYDLLDFPETLEALGEQVDVDVEADIADRRIARAGLDSSGFAQRNRMLERHERIGNLGTFWLSYDFLSNLGFEDIFSHPFDFNHAGSEVIYALPNGLTAYMVVDAAGNRLDAVPLTIARDERARNKAVQVALSCMGSCHYARGFEPIVDELRKITLSTTPVGVNLDDVRAVFPAQRTLDDLLARDRARYIDATRALDVDLTIEAAPYQTVELNRGDIDLKLAGCLMQLSEEEMRLALLGASASLPGQVRGLSEGRTMSRQDFERAFAQTVCAVGLGEPLCAARDCGCATLAP